MNLPRVSLKPSTDENFRRCARVLQMVHELHKTGYQGIRISPGLNASGCAWRVGITPITNICRNHGAYLVDWESPFPSVHYSSANETQYFGWDDAATDSARELAAKFIERFPRIAEAGLLSDWPYAGWYVQMLGFVEREEFPISYTDFMSQPRKGFLPTSRNLFSSELPMPPGGLSEEIAELPYLL